jgi:Amt family ammonium transporter
MSVSRFLSLSFAAAAIGLLVLLPAQAQESANSPAPAIDHGDNAWMLVSSALVLLMTAPGLAMFYGGLVRKKNVLGVIMQCFFLMALNTVVWGIYGYSLSFGGHPKLDSFNAWVGNGEFLFMRDVAPTSPADYPLEGTIPRLTHMLFQGMFFIITPALICGAFAERMKFSAMVAFMLLWDTVVYCPLCHWVWDGGILAYGSKHAIFPALDFAGGTVVHISSGVSALVCALVIGKRVGFGHEPMPPHNLAFTTLGAALLWVGWFGFNAGSALAANGAAASAFTATHFAAASGALTWAVIEWMTRGKPTVLGTCSGAVAGLVCITPASGYVQPMPALLMGVAAGAVCCGSCLWLKARLGYDDSLDAFGVHGVGGTLGALLTGIFATKEVFGSEPLGLLEHGNLLTAQVGAVAVTWALAAVSSFVLLKVVDVAIGLRLSPQDERQGVDLSQHGEEGYIFV